METFGSMEKEEKVRFILEQMRLGLARKDYIRTQIISKKISIKFFASDTDIVQVKHRILVQVLKVLEPTSACIWVFPLPHIRTHIPLVDMYI